MSVYLHLFHGRTHPGEQLNDWGRNGPVLGPLDYVHVTYLTDLRLGDAEATELQFVDDLVYYDGIYYGDWSVYSDPRLDGGTPEAPDPAKAVPPTTPKEGD